MGNPSAPSNVLNLDIHPYTETGKVNITIELQYDEKKNIIANVTEINVDLNTWTLPQSIIDPTSTSIFQIYLPEQQSSVINDAISQSLVYTFSTQMTEIIAKWSSD